ncbi:unnamed protein product [Arctogadus glacialis]
MQRSCWGHDLYRHIKTDLMLKCQAKEFTFFVLLTAGEQGRESFLFLLLTAHVSYWFIQGPMKEEDVFPGTVYPLLGKLLFFLPDRYKKKLCCTGQSVSTNTPSEPRPFKPTGDDRLRLTAAKRRCPPPPQQRITQALH